MNADQIAEIRPAIREAIQGAPRICVTLEVQGQPAKWMQVVGHTINAAYPYTDDPKVRLKGRLGLPGIKLNGWESKKFATFEFLEMESTLIAFWVDAYFVDVLTCAVGNYHIDTAFEEL